MMRRLDYQDRTLATVDAFLEALAAQEDQAERIRELRRQNPGLPIGEHDAPAAAWAALAAAGQLPASRAGVPYSPRLDGAGRSVPNATLKVPTGGGKTFLAVSAVAAAQARLLRLPTGMVLWIVPNDAIYRQTKRSLSDRQHPYRQILDRAADGRVRILEKTDTLRREDAEGALCVMLVMLASAARQQRENLKLFQDRGDVHGFVPPEGDAPAHRALLAAVPNLDHYGGAGDLWPQVKDSMGNALRILRPVVVLDEGHKGTTEIAHGTLYGFNPRLVVELTATPRDVQATGRGQPGRTANVLVDIPGAALHAEGMIKLPINLETRPDADWRATLAAAKERLDALAEDAERFQANSGRYIRPIMLVQVERVSGEAGVPGQVHARDAREWLVQAGLDPAEIAEKTSKANDLAAPENQDLLHPANRVRVIITKAALQEGWDCPFAYVLCSLANVAANAALTQLVGRILRQPGAQPTGVPALDECYVVTRYAAPHEVIRTIANGLKDDGLGDLVQEVRVTPPGVIAAPVQAVLRRPAFAGLPIHLPQVVVVEGTADRAHARPLDYEMDILASLDWRGLAVAALVQSIPSNAQPAEGATLRLELADGEELLDATPGARIVASGPPDRVHLVRMVSDLVPNPWVAWDIVAAFLDGLGARGLDEAWQAGRAGLLLDRLRGFLADEEDRMAEALFRAEVAANRIQFRLRADGPNWKMPDRLAGRFPPGTPQLPRNDGSPMQKSLFMPIFRDEFSTDPERHVAVYLDAEEVLRWWHRNVARSGYGLQGWRRHRVYPDFIVSGSRVGGDRIVAVEMKGEQLAGNADTEYKRALFDLLSGIFAREEQAGAGTLQLVTAGGVTVECRMVLLDRWQTDLPPLLDSLAT